MSRSIQGEGVWSELSAYWLKYTLQLDPKLEESFAEELASSPYTLGWMEPGIDVIRTDNGYDYRERDDVPLTAYLFEPLTDGQEERVEQLQHVLEKWAGQVTLLKVEKVREEHESWQQQFEPVQVGEWHIAPSWSGEGVVEDLSRVLWIDPGAAFGTGYHGTTQDILYLLQELPLTDKRVLDIGSGSGILSIFCAKNGASWPVYAIDINPAAADQIDHNCSLNHLPKQAVQVVIGDPLEPAAAEQLPRDADLILINIGAEEDVAMLPVVLRSLAWGGTVILSGIVEWSREMVEQAYREAGFSPIAERISGEWVTLVTRLCDNEKKA
ncbi:50S ribosomal protein L11 methyltransferase [Brevibacillus humidisoli]|uniref:50S ribosomal protein L11 methyltransferase n=1 Tax=Brevibacillus humidisoli TaxID=2895522 RepID=UPI001E560272|nr:50S ribosomal protein L11 methyltransferase [Brevibacillus humidisoli]UFJ39136.1 50S ribosomal protein L11 methyltransferase [Brevibacillus humidisoli]